jgi:hypothetical protein
VANVVADRVDFRDRTYAPPVTCAPAARLYPTRPLPVLHQHDTSACTGYSLATVIHHLHRKARLDQMGAEPPRGAVPQFSPHMLYSMARRYDEFRGSVEDTGSSLRGALKGWYRHGACELRLWPNTVPVSRMPPPDPDPARDWWQNAVRCRLGAYYRIDPKALSDMHVALDEVGILYASAIAHAGWDEPVADRSDGSFTIPRRDVMPDDGGHAFAIVGYDERGFVLQNSWDRDGLARIPYADWLDNAMDCWEAQLGVVTDEHLEVARSASLRLDERGRVKVSSERVTRDRELSPFIVNVENNGALSRSGRFRTQPSDLEALVGLQVDEAAKAWGLRANETIDIAVYAHGGLTDEDAAAKTAEKWIKALYGARVLPIFLMWETGLWSTLRNIVTEAFRGQPRPAGDAAAWLREKLQDLDDFKDQRLEGLLASPGTAIWSKMKENAEMISRGGPQCAGQMLFECASRSPCLKKRPYRLHLVGHSAGAIVHSHIVGELAKLGWEFESVSFMAPAARVDLFQEKLMPWIEKGRVKRYAQFHLTDTAERDDDTCRPILGYGKSLLYLVSESFEGGRRTPILGMERWYDEIVRKAGLRNITAIAAPGSRSGASTHCGFDEDVTTLKQVLQFMRG